MVRVVSSWEVRLDNHIVLLDSRQCSQAAFSNIGDHRAFLDLNAQLLRQIGRPSIRPSSLRCSDEWKRLLRLLGCRGFWLNWSQSDEVRFRITHEQRPKTPGEFQRFVSRAPAHVRDVL